MIDNLGLTDIWSESALYKSNRSTNLISRIDRVFFYNEKLTLIGKETDWSLGFSDHAVIISSGNTLGRKDRLIRLDSSILKMIKLNV